MLWQQRICFLSERLGWDGSELAGLHEVNTLLQRIFSTWFQWSRLLQQDHYHCCRFAKFGSKLQKIPSTVLSVDSHLVRVAFLTCFTTLFFAECEICNSAEAITALVYAAVRFPELWKKDHSWIKTFSTVLIYEIWSFASSHARANLWQMQWTFNNSLASLLSLAATPFSLPTITDAPSVDKPDNLLISRSQSVSQQLTWWFQHWLSKISFTARKSVFTS